MPLPMLETPRLMLRSLRAGDAAQFMALAGDWEVAHMTSDIPHPLQPEHAKDWLRPSGGDVRYAIELQGSMIGSAGYFRRRSGAAELGFWMGRDHWGYGFATEAAKAILRQGFMTGEDNFSSSHFADNPGSARVLAKLGFEAAGSTRIWCAARGAEVEATGLWLTRERAEAVLGPIPLVEPMRPAWAGRLGRWFGAT